MTVHFGVVTLSALCVLQANLRRNEAVLEGENCVELQILMSRGSSVWQFLQPEAAKNRYMRNVIKSWFIIVG